ncbi:cupin domain-containing protein [Phreatobacter stygius]|uniref:cupin domain-containing protein n=1 Tax=Phreatobacter stygius TaxID=1940610 RepID=UPI00147698FF|nr:cupin domain-containing protein [Phreatobacter stygius]
MTQGGGVPHAGFGGFAKRHREFFDALGADDWRPVAGYAGVEEKILSGELDPVARTGSVTRLARWAAGAAVDHAVRHDWCEEVFIVSGSLSIGTPDARDSAVVLPAGTYACRPADIVHGPFFSEAGCLLIEFTYYPPPLPAARP